MTTLADKAVPLNTGDAIGNYSQVAWPIIDDLGNHALFLDLDGTLAEIAETPDAVRVAASVLEALEALSRCVGGALAIVSGRDLAAIDQLLAPHRFAAAGVHGARRRMANGSIHAGGLAPQVIDGFAEAFRSELGHEAGLLMEPKAAAFAVHYRLRPDLKDRCEAFIRRLAAAAPGGRVLSGKAVFEIVSRDTSKGAAIRAFLAEPPFAGRRPVFAGDDVTDESGFDAVNELGGVSIKIGEGPTLARSRLAGAGDFQSWLMGLVTNRGVVGAE